MSTHAKNLTRVNWKPEYSLVCQLKATGQWSNEKIAEYFGRTQAWVSQILNTRQGKAELEAIRERMVRAFEESVQGRIARILDVGVDKLAVTVDEDFIPGSDAKKHQDNVILTVLKGTGYLAGEREGDGKKGPEGNLTPRLASRLVAALEKSNEADEIYKNSQSEVQEGEFVVEDDVIEEPEPKRKQA